MNNTIDNKVVSMQFDNKQFETNAKTSLTTLEKLQQSLKFTGATKGLESVGAAADKCNMSGMGSAIETVKAKFSALQVMGVTALANIANSAVNAGKRMISAFTIEPIKTGLAEYETQINAVQTILANTQSKGSTLKDVNGALDELNAYADKTIYNFTEMTRNIGTFTAAGVDLDKSVTSIKGIANLAAVSGSTSQQASTAMYQLSQALAAGKVQLMDWNSVVNAGMGGQVFQDALKRTAKNMGVNVDGMIKKYGSFRESLTKGEWLTADVLTETLTQLSGAYSEADLIAQGYTEEQAKEIVELSQTAVDAATKVKTFTQLIDTLKEAMQSGWTQTWEILIGDFEEAKELWTGVSDVVGEFINKTSEARNSMLQGWADGGGRTMAIEAITNAFQGLISIIKPVTEAFREVFPPITSEQLLKATERIRDLTEKFKIGKGPAEAIKNTFKGFFSIIKFGADIVIGLAKGIGKLIGAILPVGGGILSATGSFGEFISKLTEAIDVSKIFENVFNVLAMVITPVANLLKTAFNGLASGFEAMGGIVGVLDKIGDGIAWVFDKIVAFISAITNGAGLGGLVNLANGGIFAAILLGIKKFIGNFSETVENATGFLDNITEILDTVKGSLEAWQNSIKSKTLMNIAIAIGILAASLYVLSSIEPEKLGSALAAMTGLFIELFAAMAIFEKTMKGSGMKATTSLVTTMIGMSVAVLILASAMKKLADLEWDQIARGLTAVGGLIAELVGASILLSKTSTKLAKGSLGLILFATSILILGKAVKSLAELSWEELGKGLTGIGALLVGLWAFMKFANFEKMGLLKGAGLLLFAASMKVLAGAVGSFAQMQWDQLGRGLAGLAGGLTVMIAALHLMPQNVMGKAASLLIISAALIVLSKAMSAMGGMSWDEIGRSLVVLAGSLLILAGALHLMNGTLAGTAALMLATVALLALTPVLKILGSMSLAEIGKALLALAGTFTVLGLAGLILGPIVPVILGLAAAVALLGVGVLACGVGVATLAAGLTALGVAFTVSGAAIIVAIKELINLIPYLAVKIGEGIVQAAVAVGNGSSAICEAFKQIILALLDVFVELIPDLADGLLKLIVGLLDALVQYTPQIVDGIFNFLIAVINGIASRLPELIQAGVNVLNALVEGVMSALGAMGPDGFIKAFASVGILVALMVALAACAALAPAAMLGVLGITGVLAEIGAISKIPGLTWLIGEGASLMQAIGNAIGNLIGGLIGGVGEGISASLPQIATDLSTFMTNLSPFLSGMAGVDPTMMDSVQALAGMILALTGASILEAVTSWLTGGSSLSDFAAQLVPFGQAMVAFSTTVSGIDESAVVAAANAGKILAEMAATIPNTGGVMGFFAGENDMTLFGSQIVAFGTALAAFSRVVSGQINEEAVTAAANAGSAMVALADTVPNTGGLISFFSGDNDLATFGTQLSLFGKSLVNYSKSVSGLDTGAIQTSVSAAKGLVGLADILPESGGLWSVFSADNDMSTFGKELEKFGKSMSAYSSAISGINIEQLAGATAQFKNLANLAKGLSGVDFGGLGSFGESLGKIGTNGINSFIQAFKNAGTKLNTAGKQVVKDISSGITKNKNLLKTAGKSSGTEVSKGVKEARSSIESSGKYLVQGLANGITNSAYLAYAAGKYAGQQAKKGIDDALRVESPSKEAYESGRFTGMGLANGIIDFASKVYNAGYDLGDHALSGLKATMSRLSAAVSTDIDSQPTIRPVLDLSDVRAGAGAIGSMFGMNSPIRALADVGVINSSMRTGQNGSNDDVVAAIKDLGRKLSDSSGDSYSIDGITYDDGSAVADAIKSLIRATRIERRV